MRANPSVACVVVTYEPDGSLVENVRRLAAESDLIFLVDNASSSAAMKWVEAAAAIPGVSLVRNGSNLGIATALNIGMRLAREKGYSWIATFDQDTKVPTGYFQKLFSILGRCSGSENVGMLVPGAWVEPGHVCVRMPAEEYSFVPAALTSGSVIRSSILHCTGDCDERLFIDYVDVEFCLRVRRSGFKIVSANAVAVEHDLGHKQTRVILGREIGFRVHAPWRYYYIMRNRLLVARRYALSAPGWVLRDLAWIIPELGRIAVLEQERIAKLGLAVKGLWHGMLNQSGKHPTLPRTNV
jgi:Predicted glycosyltransferases